MTVPSLLYLRLYTYRDLIGNAPDGVGTTRITWLATVHPFQACTHASTPVPQHTVTTTGRFSASNSQCYSTLVHNLSYQAVTVRHLCRAGESLPEQTFSLAPVAAAHLRFAHFSDGDSGSIGCVGTLATFDTPPLLPSSRLVSQLPGKRLCHRLHTSAIRIGVLSSTCWRYATIRPLLTTTFVVL